MFPMAKHFSKQGYRVHVMDLRPPDGTVPIEVLSGQLVDWISSQNSREVAVIGFSMGGLVARHAVQMMGAGSIVKKLITIASPNRGTGKAKLLPIVACKQMREGSDFMCRLDSEGLDQLEKTGFECVWTPFDAVITPAENAYLKNFPHHKTHCPLHIGCLVWPRVWKICLDCLDGAGSEAGGDYCTKVTEPVSRS